MAQTITGISVILQPADTSNVGALIAYTLDPAVQGVYKAVPRLTISELEQLFLRTPDRLYYEVLTTQGESIGRFYLRAWQFAFSQSYLDIELNIILKPSARRQGFGTEAQALGIRYAPQLFNEPVCSVFAYTDTRNMAEQRALLQSGMQLIGPAPNEHYPVPVAPNRFVLFAVEVSAVEQKAA